MMLGKTYKLPLAAACGCALLMSTLSCGSSSASKPGASTGGGSAGDGTTTGGSQSSGGDKPSESGGSGMLEVPPVKVPPVNCSGLAAKVGVWEDITPPALQLAGVETFAVVVSPTDGTVYAAGSNKTSMPGGPLNSSGIIRSSDCGSTFERAHDVKEGTDNSNLITGSIWALVISETKPQVLYLSNGYGNNPTIYRSVDAAVTWKALDAGVNFVSAIGIERGNENHIAVTFHNNCEAPRKPWCFSTSTDGGDHWTMFDGPTGPGITGWVEGAAITVLGPTSYVVGSVAGIWYTGDTGATWKQVASDALYLTYSGGSAIVNGNLLHAGTGHVLISKAAPGKDPPFELANGSMLDVIPNSAPASAFVNAGKLVFGGNGQPDMQPIWTAPADDLMTWTKTDQDICTADKKFCRGPAELGYDPVHHVVYAANWGVGLWRYVIE